MKKILFLFIILFSLVSCQNYQNTIDKFDYNLYNGDLTKLENPVLSNTQDAYFTINSYIYSESDYYVYTVQIEYKEVKLSNIKVILLPLNIETSGLLPNIGYSQALNLTERIDAKKGNYPGYNLSYKTDIVDLDFYVFVSYANDTYIENVYSVNTFTRIGA